MNLFHVHANIFNRTYLNICILKNSKQNILCTEKGTAKLKVVLVSAFSVSVDKHYYF